MLRSILILQALCALFLFSGANLIWAASSVWVVSNGKNKIFVAGSVHFLRQSDHPLPKEFDDALSQSNTVFFETNIEALQTEKAQQQLIEQGIYPSGETLRTHLTPATLTRLERFCQTRRLPLEPLLKLKPWMLAIKLTVVELRSTGINPEDGVEPTLLRRSKEKRKATLGLVPVDEHVKTLLALNQIPADDLIAHTISETEQIGTMANDVIAAWKSGDTTTLENIFISPLEKTYPLIYRALLTDRNKRWIPILENLLRQEHSSMVVVGVGHLVGDQNVLRLLQNKGYVVDRL